jgi:FMN-dependent NADH-azoreductase
MTIRESAESRPLAVLEISASARSEDSVSRKLTRDIVGALEGRKGSIRLTRRDLADGVPFVDEHWVQANFTAAEERSGRQRETLAFSDELIAELQEADLIVIGAPIYNFGIPAALKAWVDMVARARVTFRYTENGPEGLLKGKRAIIVIASGGVPVDSAVDFATPYLRQALRFIGIDDVEVIAADRLNKHGKKSIDAARERIAEVVHAPGFLPSLAA